MSAAQGASAASPPKKRRFGSGFAVLIALVLGVVIGGYFPQDAHPTIFHLFQFISKAFLALIKGLIVPLLISTIVVGVAQTGDLRAVGRMGAKALLWFETVTTLALFLGLGVANILKPGVGLPLDLGIKATGVGPQPSGWDTALHLFPSNLAKHAAEGDILPIVIFAVLLGVSLVRLGDRGKPVFAFFDSLAHAMFGYTDLIMKLTPVGVFGAMAQNTSHMAAGHLVNGEMLRGWSGVFWLLGRYAKLVGSLYFALFLLVLLVFVPTLLVLRISVLKFFRAFRDPIATAYATASSESALPRLLERLVEFGVPNKVASFVVPAGYSFNLDGSTLYLCLASLTIAQASGVDMPLSRQVVMLLTFMLTSKGVAGVPRATLVIIAAACQSFDLPGEAGVAMILAVDEVMDMARSAVNVTGNAVAAIVVAKWEGNFLADGVTPDEVAGELPSADDR